MTQSNEHTESMIHQNRHWYWLAPLLYMVFVSLYFVLRYGGTWAEADSATFAVLTRAFAAEGRLVPRFGPAYPNGYTFQAISTFIMGVTGVDVSTLQQLVYPFIAPMVVLPAWMLYRELTGSGRGATFATILLFTQPEFLFVILRSSHEKFTRTLLMLCLFFLLRSLKLQDRPWLLAAHVGLFYLAAFAFIASNNLLAHSFIFAVFIALVLGRMLEKRNESLRQFGGRALPHLRYVTFIGVALVYVFTFYVYSPAQHDFLVLKSIWDHVATLFLDVQENPATTTYTDAYGVIATGWVSIPVYFIVSSADWIVLGASFAVWLLQGLRWLWQGQAPKTQSAWLLWLFYAAFAGQGVLSVVADASGAMSSNLQLRLFPSISIFAVAMVGSTLDQWRPHRITPWMRLALAISIFWIAVFSVFKAINEPLVSNKWTFYRPNEIAALDWTDAHLKDTSIWTGYDERLVVAYDTARGDVPNHDRFQGFGVRPSTQTFVISTITRLRSARLGAPLPIPSDAFRVYDNGEAAVYHLRPQTPYQP